MLVEDRPRPSPADQRGESGAGVDCGCCPGTGGGATTMPGVATPTGITPGVVVGVVSPCTGIG